MNMFDPVLSAGSYVGHVKENDHIVHIEPTLHASDTDPSSTLNGLLLYYDLLFFLRLLHIICLSSIGKICGYELSLHKHDDIANDITQNIPFTVEMVDNQPIVKLKSNSDALDCEVKQIHQMYIRAFDCAPGDRRRYSER